MFEYWHYVLLLLLIILRTNNCYYYNNLIFNIYLPVEVEWSLAYFVVQRKWICGLAEM